MAGTAYKIKLYGQTGNDPRVFCVQAASLLEVDREHVARLLESAPVIVKEGLSKTRALGLLQALKAINGLVMLEHSDGIVPVSDLQATYEGGAHFAVRTRGASGRPGGPDPEEGRKEWGFRIWAGIFIGIATSAVILGGVAYFHSYSQVRAVQEGLSRARSESFGPLRKQKDAQEKQKLEKEIADLKEQVRFFESAVADAKVDVDKRMHAYRKAYNQSRGADTTELILARNGVDSATAGHRENEGILIDLKRRLNEAEERYRYVGE